MNDTLKLINELRTVHGNFSDKEIPKQILDDIIAAALRTANASGRQSYSMIILSDREKMRKIFGYAGNKAVIFCVDFNRIIEMAKNTNNEFDVEEIIPFITGTIDTMLLTQTFVIAAKSCGIDSLITNGLHRENIDEIYEMLNLPEKYCFPLIAVVLGYAPNELKPIKGRLNGKGIVHYEKYEHLTLPEINNIISEYDNKEKNLGLINNWEKMGFEHYLDWFYKKWTRKMSDKKVNEIKNRLIRSGFLK